MATTNFPNGLSSFGIPLTGDMPNKAYGKRFFVDAKVGVDGRNGRSPDKAFKTMAEAFQHVSSGDVILVRGKVREQISTPAGVFDVTVIGASNNPRHADDHTESDGARGSSGATWTTPAAPTAATPLLIVRQQGWTFENILFDGPADASCVQLLRDAGAGDLERDASHAEFSGCRFDGSLIGIENNGGAGFVRVERCRFYRQTGAGAAGIKTTSTSVAVPLNWNILDSHFADNASHILSSLSLSLIKGNTFGKFTGTLSVDVQNNAGQGGDNVITENYLSGTYGVTAYPAGTANEWAGNKNVAGETTADPI